VALLTAGRTSPQRYRSARWLAGPPFERDELVIDAHDVVLGDDRRGALLAAGQAPFPDIFARFKTAASIECSGIENTAIVMKMPGHRKVSIHD
jgi:hypothetical protein